MSDQPAENKATFHAHVPFDKIHRTVFIPDKLIEDAKKKNIDSGDFISTTLADVTVNLLHDAQAYIVVKERPSSRDQDGTIFKGTEYDLQLMVGKPPLVIGTDGRDHTDINQPVVIASVN